MTSVTIAGLWAAVRRRDEVINSLFAALKDEKENLINGAGERLRALLHRTAVTEDDVADDEWVSLPTYAAVEADRKRAANKSKVQFIRMALGVRI